ncbi:unnamed protein product [Parnassius apollo]|uniref:(apollo) hypothetical protein n=1 Tax=Parnassius apollo TaxID=110799 RepID=A0A8S3XTU8_PARAO|nr:unnamed protein product [Parnassius apollo]
MSDKRCCVPGCKDSKGKLVLHRFPNPEKESERLRTLYSTNKNVEEMRREIIELKKQNTVLRTDINYKEQMKRLLNLEMK